MSDIYNQAVKEILTDPSPVPKTIRTKEELEAEIAEISRELKGPLSNLERLDLLEARSFRRKQLSDLTATSTTKI